MGKVLRILLLVLLLVVVVVLVGGFVWFDRITRGPLPQHGGEIALAGLNAPVEILRDSWGVPHIYAENLHDLYYAQGFTHAQDRWWQMEFSRHIGSGRIGELTGKNDDIIGNDMFIRTIGWRRMAEADAAVYPEPYKTYLQNFADGVNAYLNQRDPSQLALEYNVLGLTGINIPIEPWTISDSLVWAKVMAWDLGDNSDEEDLRADLAGQLPQELIDALMLPFPYGEKPTMLQDGEVTPEPAPAGQASVTNPGSVVMAGNTSPADRFAFGEGDGIGSNNWVATGSMTTSGGALMANDPHIGIQMPSIWYETGLHCQPVSDACPIDVVGFSFPLAPGVVIGHNADISWGVTDATDDVQDYYYLTLNPENPLQYEWNGEWRDMTVREESLVFGDGEDPITFQVRDTHLGAIINDNRLDENGQPGGFNLEDPMVLRWTATEPSTLFQAVFELNRASNWGDFRNALRNWDIPAQNVIYGDTEGNIGYQLPGRIPIRPEGFTGQAPVEAASDAQDWLGYLPFESHPSVYNPARNFIATANQAIVPLSYYDLIRDDLADTFGENANYQIATSWDYGYRGQRITQLLEDTAPHSVETYRAIQNDNFNGSAAEILPYLRELSLTDSTQQTARDWLLEWDMMNNVDSGQAALYMLFWKQLVTEIYQDQMPEDVLVGGGGQTMWATYQLMEQPEHEWWDDVSTADTRETRDDILAQAFDAAYQEAVTLMGADRTAWKWGTLHTATFVSNPLGLSGVDALEGLVNRGPFPTGGGSSVVNAISHNIRSGDLTVRGGIPSMRMIVDLTDFTQSVTMHTTGQSGHPMSPHYDQMIESWRTGQYHPMLWTREQVEGDAQQRLTLRPAG